MTRVLFQLVDQLALLPLLHHLVDVIEAKLCVDAAAENMLSHSWFDRCCHQHTVGDCLLHDRLILAIFIESQPRQIVNRHELRIELGAWVPRDGIYRDKFLSFSICSLPVRDCLGAF